MTNHKTIVRLRAVAAFSAFAVAVAGVSLPAQAAESGVKAASSESAAMPSAGSKGSNQRAKGTKYCFITGATGSRIERQVCKTKAEWSREGVDVDAY